MKYYKFLSSEGAGMYSNFKWPLPSADAPGAWTPEIVGDIVECERGYHAATLHQALLWLRLLPRRFRQE